MKVPPDDQERAFNAFHRSVRDNRMIDEHTKLMLYLSAARASGCSS